MPQREADSHKGRFGLAARVVELLHGGWRELQPCRNGRIAWGGLVRVAVPSVSRPSPRMSPCYMTVPLVSDRRGRIALDALPEILHHAEQATVMAVDSRFGSFPRS